MPGPRCCYTHANHDRGWMAWISTLLILSSAMMTAGPSGVEGFLYLDPARNIHGTKPMSVVHGIWNQPSLYLSPSRLCAKKGKGKKGGGGGGKQKNQQKGGFEWASSFVIQPYEAATTCELTDIALAAYRGISGKPLFAELVDGATASLPKALWNAPVACVIVTKGDTSDAGEASDDDDSATKNDGGSVVKYANVAALETLGLKPDEFEKLFSTSPKPATPEIKLALPTSLNGDKKLERGYRKKIWQDTTILEASRWSIEKSMLLNGKFVTEPIGVAYVWEEWMKGEDTVCKPGGATEVIAEGEELGDLDERIAKQGDVIRDLKENQGLGNKDPPVVEAVAELLRLKALK